MKSVQLRQHIQMGGSSLIRQITIFFNVFLLVLSLLSTPVVAKNEKKWTDFPGNAAKVAKKVDLKPAKGVERKDRIVVDQAAVITYDDGSTVFLYDIRGKQGRYDYTIVPDLESQTYDIIEKNSDEEVVAQSMTYRGVNVYAYTMDPVAVPLARTNTNLVFADDGSTIQWVNNVGSCWAANPSALNTNWYTDPGSCFGNSGTVQNGQANGWWQGTYYNFDGPLCCHDEPTWAYHRAEAYGIPGPYRYRVTGYAWHSGPFSYLLIGGVALDSYWTN